MKSLEERVQEAMEKTLEVTKDRVSIRIDLTDKEKEIFVKCVEKITGKKKPKSFVGFRGGKVDYEKQ